MCVCVSNIFNFENTGNQESPEKEISHLKTLKDHFIIHSENLICGLSLTQETGILLMFTLWWRHHRLAHETVSKFRWNIPGDMNSQSDVEFKIAMASYIHCQRLRPDIFPEIVMLPGKDIEEKFKLSRLMGHSRKTQWSPNGVPYILEPQQGQEFESYVVISVNNTQQISRTSHSSYRSFIRKSLEIPTLECYEKF